LNNAGFAGKSEDKIMKKWLPLLVWVGMGLVALLVIFVFILQLQSHQTSRKELDSKNEELKEAQSASRKMEELEKKSQELKQKENKMKKRVVVGDIQPLGLIKTITGTANKLGLRKIRFELKSASATASKDSPAAPVVAGSGPIPVYFQMKFNSTFSQVIKFLGDLKDLERIVTVEKIEIDREDNTIPYQAVILDLATYYFPE
jgi:Tfp pilus assembly protein PilO